MQFLRKYYSQLIFLIIGFLVGLFISRLPIEFEPKVNWVQLSTFFLTILLALYLEFVVRPSISNNRNEKDILIDQLKEIKTQISELNSFYLSVRETNPLESEKKSEIVAKFRDLSNQIDLLKQTDLYCTTTRKSEISDRLFRVYLGYKRAVTGNKFNTRDFYFDRLNWSKHEAAHKELLKILMRSIIDINKK